MRILYLDCGMGAAGDMLAGALVSILSKEEQESFIKMINNIGVDGVKVSLSDDAKCGIVGKHFKVEIDGVEEHSHDVHEHEHHHEHEQEHGHHHEHHHHGKGPFPKELEAVAEKLDCPNDIQKVYELLAEAEAKVHGKYVSEIHFHEVGMKDALIDIASVVYLMNKLKVDKVVVSPVNVGFGKVKCAHGILPVPAPATARILQGIPIYSEDIKGELCTPTGAALLKHFVSEFGSMPAMIVEKDGYGMGTKEFPRANCVRVMIGDTEEKADDVIEISTNLDDMTAEEIGFAMEVLMEEGALDAYCQPIVMKKSRPATRLVCMCKPDDKNRLSKLIFKHTTAIGIRINKFERIVLERSFDKVETPWGDVTVKTCMGQGTTKKKAEFDDLARIARDNGLSLREVSEKIEM